jgi:hypothetical protein
MRKTLAQFVSLACGLMLVSFEAQAARPAIAASHHLITNAGPKAILASSAAQDVPDALLGTGVVPLAAPAGVTTFVSVAESPVPARPQLPAQHNRAPPLN